MRHLPDDPASMTPPERRREIAAILARGVLRLRQCAQSSPSSGESRTPEKASESGRAVIHSVNPPNRIFGMHTPDDDLVSHNH